MSNYLVDGADLTSVANAIRTKGGTSAQLQFPTGFVDAVEAIETGGGGGSAGISTFDFTQSLYDQETGLYHFVATGAIRDSTGLHISTASDLAELNNVRLSEHVIEIVTGDMQKSFSGHGRFCMFAAEKGLIYRNTGYWMIYNGAWVQQMSNDIDYFANCTLRFEFGSEANANLYRDNILLFSDVNVGGNSYLAFGASSNAFFPAAIKKCTIMTTEAYALRVLLEGA